MLRFFNSFYSHMQCTVQLNKLHCALHCATHTHSWQISRNGPRRNFCEVGVQNGIITDENNSRFRLKQNTLYVTDFENCIPRRNFFEVCSPRTTGESCTNDWWKFSLCECICWVHIHSHSENCRIVIYAISIHWMYMQWYHNPTCYMQCVYAVFFTV